MLREDELSLSQRDRIAGFVADAAP